MTSMNVSLTMVSRNEKTGKLPVSMTSAKACPESCPLKGNACYAELGPIAWHWKKVTNGTKGDNWNTFCEKISNLKDGIAWRHNQAGDLIGDGYHIDHIALRQLISANTGKRGFTYTHYDPRIGFNADIIKESNENGFTINLSADNLTEADSFVEMGIGPVVTILPLNAEKITMTPKGNKVVLCPATYNDKVTCKSCLLCQKQRKTIIGFPVHGLKKKTAEKIFFS